LCELALAEELLMARGVIALDDFANLNYSQNIAAIYKYLFTTRTELTPFLVTAEKAYLCRKQDFGFYGSFVLHESISAMQRRGLDEPLLARTDSHPDYRAFHLRTRGPDEKGHLYAYDIYKGYYVEA
jgi:hypothetical protein